LNSSELVAGASAWAATTVNTDASEPRLGGGLVVLRFHEYRRSEGEEERILGISEGKERKEEEEGKKE